jgi:hypothetical protein
LRSLRTVIVAYFIIVSHSVLIVDICQVKYVNSRLSWFIYSLVETMLFILSESSIMSLEISGLLSVNCMPFFWVSHWVLVSSRSLSREFNIALLMFFHHIWVIQEY